MRRVFSRAFGIFSLPVRSCVTDTERESISERLFLRESISGSNRFTTDNTQMGQETLEGSNLSEPRAEYNRKLTEELPAQAQSSDGWPLHLDHCFGRGVLDNPFGDEWYGHVDGGPAYKHLSQKERRDPIGIAGIMLTEGEPAVEELNRNSLWWRDKLK